MKKNIFYSVVCILLFISCKKSADSPAADIRVNFSKKALEYVQMAPNKYFIYKDSATSVTDSVIVTQSVLVTLLMPAHQSQGLFDPNQPAYYYQTFTLLLSKVSGNTSADWFYGIADTNPYAFSPVNTDTAGLRLLERDRSLNWDKLYVFNYPFLKGNQNIISNITIEGKSYADVVQFSVSSSLVPSNPNYAQYYFASTYYWAKGLGVIKRTLTTASSKRTWSLVRNG